MIAIPHRAAYHRSVHGSRLRLGVTNNGDGRGGYVPLVRRANRPRGVTSHFNRVPENRPQLFRHRQGCPVPDGSRGTHRPCQIDEILVAVSGGNMRPGMASLGLKHGQLHRGRDLTGNRTNMSVRARTLEVDLPAQGNDHHGNVRHTVLGKRHTITREHQHTPCAGQVQFLQPSTSS